MKWLLLILLTCTGCLGNAFYVDERFTAEECNQIRAAADSWVEVGAQPIDFIWRQHVTGTETGKRTLIRAREREAVALWGQFATGDYDGVDMQRWDRETIVIDVEHFPGEYLQQVVAHELGHYYLGGWHLSDDRALMYRQPVVLTPTALDRQALARVQQ